MSIRKFAQPKAATRSAAQTNAQVQACAPASALTRRSFLTFTVTTHAALVLPAIVGRSGFAAANDPTPPEGPGAPRGAALRPNPHGFPEETRDQRALWEAFGDPLDDTLLVKVPTPWPMPIAGMPGNVRRHLWAHVRVADSLCTVLELVADHYGLAEVRRLGLDVFGGDHVDRSMTGARRWSTHAWGIALDIDPMNNAYRWSHQRARFAHPAYADWWRFWRQEGWYAMGPERDFDYMHIQAAIRTY